MILAANVQEVRKVVMPAVSVPAHLGLIVLDEEHDCPKTSSLPTTPESCPVVRRVRKLPLVLGLCHLLTVGKCDKGTGDKGTGDSNVILPLLVPPSPLLLLILPTH